MYEYYDSAPENSRAVKDSAVRAFSIALNIEYKEIKSAMLNMMKYLSVPHLDSRRVWKKYLSYYKHEKIIFDASGERMTAGKFSELYPSGIYILTMSRNVVTVCENGILKDRHDPSKNIVYTAYKLLSLHADIPHLKDRRPSTRRRKPKVELKTSVVKWLETLDGDVELHSLLLKRRKHTCAVRFKKYNSIIEFDIVRATNITTIKKVILKELSSMYYINKRNFIFHTKVVE